MMNKRQAAKVAQAQSILQHPRALLQLDRAHGVFVGKLVQDTAQSLALAGLPALKIVEQQSHGAVCDLRLPGAEGNRERPCPCGACSKPARTSRASRRITGSCASSEMKRCTATAATDASSGSSSR